MELESEEDLECRVCEGGGAAADYFGEGEVKRKEIDEGNAQIKRMVWL